MRDRPARVDELSGDQNRPGGQAVPGRIRCLGSMRVRIDQGVGPGQDQAHGRGSLLQAFRSWGRAQAPRPERRADPRHGHVECLAWVGWRTWRGFRMNDAVPINLSRGGARVFLDERPPVGRPVWVFLETPGRKAVVKGEVFEVETTTSGQCSARVGFREPCPYDLFEAAVCGLAPSDPRTRLAAAPRLARRPRVASAVREALAADDD